MPFAGVRPMHLDHQYFPEPGGRVLAVRLESGGLTQIRLPIVPVRHISIGRTAGLPKHRSSGRLGGDAVKRAVHDI